MTEGSASAARVKWRAYFEKVIEGSRAEVDAATEAAMLAIGRQASQNGIIAAGYEGAAAYRSRAQSHDEGRTGSDGQRPPVAPRPDAPRAASLQVGDERSGVVTGLQQRQEPGTGRNYLQVWAFRVERRAADGSAIRPVPVELRGKSIRGQLANGDLVEIPRKPSPQSIRNLTTGAVVETRGRSHPVLQRLATTVVLLIFLAIFVSFAITWFRGG